MATIITGAASGIGLATSKLLQENGHDVVLWDINAEQLQDAAKSLNAHYNVVDVTDYQQICDALSTIDAVETLIHCAGIAYVGSFTDLPIEQHQRIVQVNLTGTMNIAHAALPYLKHSQGSLIMVSSASSFAGIPDFASYGATKAAVVRFAEALRLELEKDKVHVGVIAPHFVETPMLNESRKSAMYDGADYTYTPDDMAQAIYTMLQTRKAVAIPGVMNKLNYFLSRHLPEVGPLIVKTIWQQGKKKRGNN